MDPLFSFGYFRFERAPVLQLGNACRGNENEKEDDRFAKTAEEGKEKPKNMCEVLDRVENRGIQKGRVMEYVELRREEGYDTESILQGLKERFHLTTEQAMRYLEK